jgi:outer membrane biosynthesis protein TonB
MPTSGSSVPDPTVAPAEELRWRLGALVSAHGERLATDADAWRACEIELSALYSGPYAVRTYAIVQALKGGLVADLVSWHAEGARGYEPELAQRLTERSGVSRPIAEWAVGAWAFAFGLRPTPTSAAPAAAAASAAASAPLTAVPIVGDVQPALRHAPEAPAREIVVRVPHLISAGAVTAFAVTVLFASGFAAVPRALGLFGDAAASTPALPPAPDLEPPPRATRTMPSQERWETPARAQRCNAGEAAESSWDERPRLVRDHPPAFPGELLDEGLDRGSVTLRYTVSANGLVETESVEILRASHPLFARAATEVLELLRYRPARSNGCAVSSEVTRIFRFRE